MLGLTQCPPFPSLPLHSLPQVDAFYNFWYSFKSWREFPHPDEEDIEQVRQRSLPPALPSRRAALLLVAPATRGYSGLCVFQENVESLISATRHVGDRRTLANPAASPPLGGTKRPAASPPRGGVGLH